MHNSLNNSKGRTPTKEQKFFDDLVEATGENWWGNLTAAGIRRQQRRAQLTIEKLMFLKDPLVLELGCGVGSFSMFLLEKLPSLRLRCCDISPKAVKVASSRNSGYPFVHFEIADATSLGYSHATFDAVIGNSILHHLPVEMSLQECLRVLKPRGFIYFFEPNMMNPQVAIEKNIHFIGKLLQNTEGETAFFRWLLTKTLEKTGFQDICVQPFDFLHPLIPKSLVDISDNLCRLFEKIPFLREFSGSLLVYASKPDINSTI